MNRRRLGFLHENIVVRYFSDELLPCIFVDPIELEVSSQVGVSRGGIQNLLGANGWPGYIWHANGQKGRNLKLF